MNSGRKFIILSRVDKKHTYLCIVKIRKNMSKEVINWIENFAEVENLINDLGLEFASEQ